MVNNLSAVVVYVEEGLGIKGAGIRLGPQGAVPVIPPIHVPSMRLAILSSLAQGHGRKSFVPG